jgi:hypothetical protein
MEKFQTVLLLVIAVEIALVYAKLGRTKGKEGQ